MPSQRTLKRRKMALPSQCLFSALSLASAGRSLMGVLLWMRPRVSVSPRFQ